MVSFPLVTIITPSFNQAHFLEETILSVLNQDYPNIEYMVIDGGSTDGSPEIIKKYSNQTAFWVSEKDSGQTEAINKGWRRAKGKYITWLNSDDLLLPNALSSTVEFLETHPNVQGVYGDFERIDENSNHIEDVNRRQIDWPLDLKDIIFPITQPGSLVRHDVINDIGLLNQKLYFCMDLDFFIRIALKYGEQSVVYIPTTLTKFRYHSLSKSVKDEKIRVIEILELYQSLFSRPTIPPNWKKVKSKALSNAYRLISLNYSPSLFAWRNLIYAWLLQFPVPDRDLLKTTSILLNIFPLYKKIIKKK
jgi:glycosyltransferase involved in cell wall biosynthesis